MKPILPLIIMILLSLSLVACQQETLPPDARTAKKHIENLDYKVLSYEGRVSTYTLTEETLNDMPYSVLWDLPGNNPEPYMGKTVHVEKFKIKNHPLDRWRSGWIMANGKVYAFVHMVDGKVAGGSSYPVLSKWEDHLSGGYWSLDGRTNDD